MRRRTRARAAAAGAAAVLLALCAGQFLMALDSSVMNVSIATVAADLGTTITGIQSAIVLYTLVMAMLMITGGQDRVDHRAQAGLRDRAGDLLRRLADHGPGAEPRRPAPGLVPPGGDRGGADHAGDRGPGGRELPARGPPAGLRPGGGVRGDRHRRRPADRRPGDDLRLVALGLRRRGAHRGRDPPVRPPRRRRPGRGAPPARPARLAALGAGPGAGGRRRAAVLGVGLVRAGARAPPRCWACRRCSGSSWAGWCRCGCSWATSGAWRGPAASRWSTRRCSPTAR